MIGIDLFSGAGGMSLGAELAGVDVRYAVEANPVACATYHHNHPNTELIPRRIEEVTAKDFKGIRLKRKDLVVFGGPPCQGFSTSNQRTRTKDNPNNWLFKEYIRLVNELQPEWVVFENVTGITQTDKGSFLEHVRFALAEIGYPTTQWILNAADFGVPQLRSRLFLIANRSELSVDVPHMKIRRFTVHDAIGDLPVLPVGASIDMMSYGLERPSAFAKRLRGRMACSSNHFVTNNQAHILARYRHVPQGGNWEDIPHSLMLNYRDITRCHKWIYRRLSSDQPSVVIGNYRKNMLIHPTQDRGLSVREAARLQSFPDRYHFHGTVGLQQQQVGNAVPPLLARAVFNSLLQAANARRRDPK